MATTRIKERAFHNNHYNCAISYLIGGTVPQLIRFLEQRHGKGAIYYSWSTPFKFGNDAADTDGYQFHVNAPLGDGEIFYVWLHDLNTNLLAHETFHLVGDILHTRGIKYSYNSEESFAYLQGEIFDEIFKLLKGSFRKRK
jgi:hypothetical protein